MGNDNIFKINSHNHSKHNSFYKLKNSKRLYHEVKNTSIHGFNK